jgi:hypothetical protein
LINYRLRIQSEFSPFIDSSNSAELFISNNLFENKDILLDFNLEVASGLSLMAYLTDQMRMIRILIISLEQ